MRPKQNLCEGANYPFGVKENRRKEGFVEPKSSNKAVMSIDHKKKVAQGAQNLLGTAVRGGSSTPIIQKRVVEGNLG